MARMRGMAGGGSRCGLPRPSKWALVFSAYMGHLLARTRTAARTCVAKVRVLRSSHVPITPMSIPCNHPQIAYKQTPRPQHLSQKSNSHASQPSR